MIVCIAGKNNIAINCLNYLIKNKELLKIKKIYSICNQDDNGYDNWQKSFRKFSNTNGIEILELNDVININDIFFISLEFDKIINIDSFKTNKLFNIHFSLLPKYRGCYTSIWPIINGEKYSGVTLHKIDKGIDTGSIIAHRRFDIGINNTARDLYFKLIEQGSLLFYNNIGNILSHNYISKEQNYLYSSYYSRNSIDFSINDFDLNKTSFEIHNKFRAFIFQEYQLPVFRDHKIIKSIILDQKINKKSVVEFDDYFEISGIDRYKIILKKLK